MSVDDSELRRLGRDLSRAPARIQKRASQAVRKTLRDIEADAKRINAATAFDTGNLNNSIGTDVDPDSLGGVVGPTVDYGYWVENGSHGPYAIPNAFGWGITVMHPGNSPHPFMAPAFDRREPLFTRAIGQLGEGSVF